MYHLIQRNRSCSWLTVLGWGLIIGLLLGNTNELAGKKQGRTKASAKSKSKGVDERRVQRAVKDVEDIAQKLLADYLISCRNLTAVDIQEIQGELKKCSRFTGKFNQREKASLYLVQSLVAHYSGDSAEALEMAKKAGRDDLVEKMDKAVASAARFDGCGLMPNAEEARAVINDVIRELGGEA